MKDHSGCKRAYIRSSHAWYKSVVTGTEVMVGFYSPDGGTSGEFKFTWTNLIDQKPPVAQLHAFEDSWSALYLFADLLEEMSKLDNEYIQEPDFCKIMDKLGIIDITEYERGNKKNLLR